MWADRTVVGIATNFRNRISNNTDRERGAVLVLTALVMMLLLFIAAFATDLGAWYRQGQEQQRAADVGALNGVQSYDSAVKSYFATLPGDVKLWSQLTPAQQQQAELEGLQAAAETIIGLLETTGLTFSDTGSGTPASDPTDVSSTSEYRITADDGTVIIITRAFVVNGKDSLGNDVWGRSIDVQVTAPGEQYFSNVIRDAPEIERQASSVLSNCSADCSQDITLTPPLRGFNAAGSGDGFRPLVDLDTERVWLLNHLWDSNAVGAVGPYTALGWQQIVCMDARAQAPCTDWAPLDKEFYGSVIPDEAIDLGRGRLYYAGMGQSVAPNAQGRRTGLCDKTANFNGTAGADGNWIQSNCEFMIGCVNTITRGHCAPTKISDGAWGGGPWFINDRIWAVSAQGNMFCIHPDRIGSASPWCDTYNANGKTTAASGNVFHQWSHYERAIITGDVADNAGNKLVIYHGMSNVFHCWDTALDQNCTGFGIRNAGTDYGTPTYYLYVSRFHRYAPDGTVLGWCVSRSNGYVGPGPVQHKCVNGNGTILNDPVTGMTNNQASALTWTQYVTSQSRSGELKMYHQNYAGIRNTLNNGGTPNDGGLINCYDWVAAAPCTSVDAGDDYDFYAFTEFTRDCLVGVGDVSRFYSFSPVTGGPCSSSEVQEAISPCDCEGTTEKRWGAIELPQDFKDDLITAHVFILNNADQIIDPSTGLVAAGFPSPLHPLAHDLVNDGPLVLEGLNGVHNNPLQLLAIVDGKLAADGTLQWDEPKTIRYELVVRPTLVN